MEGDPFFDFEALEAAVERERRRARRRREREERHRRRREDIQERARIERERGIQFNRAQRRRLRWHQLVQALLHG